jgi:hypothetical protein
MYIRHVYQCLRHYARHDSCVLHTRDMTRVSYVYTSCVSVSNMTRVSYDMTRVSYVYTSCVSGSNSDARGALRLSAPYMTYESCHVSLCSLSYAGRVMSLLTHQSSSLYIWGGLLTDLCIYIIKEK